MSQDHKEPMDLDPTLNDDASKKPQQDARNIPGPSYAIDAVEVKLQEFWVNGPVTWFRVSEIQFELQKSSDKAKYLATLRALPPTACKKIDDFLLNPPVQNLYNSLKLALLDRLAPSDERKLEQLLSGQDLGDGRPSEVLRFIKNLAGSNFSDHIIRSLWVRRLPPIIKTAIVGQPTATPLGELTKQADRIFEFLTPEQQLCEFSRSRSRTRADNDSRATNNNDSRTRSSESSSLTQRLSRIETILENILKGKNKNNNRMRSWSGNRPKSATPNRFRKGKHSHFDGVCFYHHFFKSKAHRCLKPCKYEREPSTSFDGQKN